MEVVWAPALVKGLELELGLELALALVWAWEQALEGVSELAEVLGLEWAAEMEPA